jgi:hypothetical protein
MKVHEAFSKYQETCESLFLFLKNIFFICWNFLINLEVSSFIILTIVFCIIIIFRKEIKKFYFDFQIWMGDEQLIAKRKENK